MVFRANGFHYPHTTSAASWDVQPLDGLQVGIFQGPGSRALRHFLVGPLEGLWSGYQGNFRVSLFEGTRFTGTWFDQFAGVVIVRETSIPKSTTPRGSMGYAKRAS